MGARGMRDWYGRNVPSSAVLTGMNERKPRTMQSIIGSHQIGFTLNMVSLTLKIFADIAKCIYSASTADAFMLTGGLTLLMLTPNLGISL